MPGSTYVHWPRDREFLERRYQIHQDLYTALTKRATIGAPVTITHLEGSIPFDAYHRWRADEERGPGAGRPRGARVKATSPAVSQQRSRTRAATFDTMRVGFTITTLAGYESLMSQEHIHIALNVHDGVTWGAAGTLVNNTRRAPRLAAASGIGVRDLADLVGHVAMAEILDRATDYWFSRCYVDKHGRTWPRQDQEAYLRQPDLTSLAVSDPTVGALQKQYRDAFAAAWRLRIQQLSGPQAAPTSAANYRRATS